jgi:hypothetical protein
MAYNAAGSEGTSQGIELDFAAGAFPMTDLTLELERTLNQLDSRSATLLERLVRDALALVRQENPSTGAVDAKGWPVGYFERMAGSFANEPFDLPDDPPPTENPNW